MLGAEWTRHLGSPAVPRRFFQALLEEYDRQCFILGMFEEGRMVAGALCFYYRDSLMPYFESSLPDARTGANDLLYWSLMCHATERGVRTFDFGRSKRDGVAPARGGHLPGGSSRRPSRITIC